jgi:hypothetical protein
MKLKSSARTTRKLLNICWTATWDHIIIRHISTVLEDWGSHSCERVLSSGLYASTLLGLFSDPEDGYDMFLRNVVWLLNGLQCVISQKMVLFLPNYFEAPVHPNGTHVCHRLFQGLCDGFKKSRRNLTDTDERPVWALLVGGNTHQRRWRLCIFPFSATQPPGAAAQWLVNYAWIAVVTMMLTRWWSMYLLLFVRLMLLVLATCD